jgi:hypothetical protein
MFKATIDAYRAQKSIIGEYLTKLGMELSDIIEINGISVVRSNFWGQKGREDVHGIYSLGPFEEMEGLIVHVQAYTSLTKDSSSPLIAAWLREAPKKFNDKYLRADNTGILKKLLEQKCYGANPALPAMSIAQALEVTIKKFPKIR